MVNTHLTVQLAAESIHVNKHTILAWIASGELPATNISSSSLRPRWRISKDDLAKFMRSRSTAKRKRKPSSKPSSVPKYV